MPGRTALAGSEADLSCWRPSNNGKGEAPPSVWGQWWRGGWTAFADGVCEDDLRVRGGGGRPLRGRSRLGWVAEVGPNGRGYCEGGLASCRRGENGVRAESTQSRSSEQEDLKKSERERERGRRRRREREETSASGEGKGGRERQVQCSRTGRRAHPCQQAPYGVILLVGLKPRDRSTYLIFSHPCDRSSQPAMQHLHFTCVPCVLEFWRGMRASKRRSERTLINCI